MMTVLSGAANACLLAIINAGADAADATEAEQAAGYSSAHLLVMFVIGMAIFVFAKRAAVEMSTQVVENMLRNLRVRVCKKIRNSELETVEHLEKSETYTRIAQDTNLISQTSFVMIDAGQQLLMLFGALIYLASLSPVAFVFTLFTACAGGYALHYLMSGVHEEINYASAREVKLLDSLSHIFFGFKELRLNERKSDSVLRALTNTADENKESKIRLALMFAKTMLFAQGFFYILIATVVFILPQYFPAHAGVLMKSTATILFIAGPIMMVVSAAPQVSRANVALDNLYKLEKTLDEAPHADPDAPPAPVLTDFRKVSLKNVVFSYTDAEGRPLFTVGPLNLTFERGELLFIVGGNGSGKSTLLKLLTGLYFPRSGVTTVDDRELNLADVRAYRELIAAIFSDFHLFDRLYGLEDVETTKVADLIRAMEIEDKVRLEVDHFSTLNLSTGQRKRMALIAALLEDKAIYVLDEWAADQDQHFRQYFYEVILRDLKAQGKTLLVVTHDDRYFHVADRVIKLELGQIVSDERQR